MAVVKHAVVEELEQTLPDGTRIWTVRCGCAQEFSSKFAMGLTPRRSARAAWRRHAAEAARGHVRVVAIEVEGSDVAIAQAARVAGALIEDGDEDD